MIGFAFDYANVASLLALKPTCALADELGIAIEWLPFGTLVRDVPESVAKSESVGQRHTRVRAEYFAKEAALYARWQGIELNRDSDGVDSTLACAGGLWAGRQGAARAYNHRVVTEFWAGRLDTENRGALARVLDDVGAPGFEGFEYEEALAAHLASISARGVFMLPTYLVEEQVFVGRAHLPMIRWLLTGRAGPGPL